MSRRLAGSRKRLPSHILRLFVLPYMTTVFSAWQFKDRRDTGHQGEMVRGGQADRTVRRARILALAKVTTVEMRF